MSDSLQALGTWSQGVEPPHFGAQQILQATRRVRESVALVVDPHRGGVGALFGGHWANQTNGSPVFPFLAILAPLYPEWLGDRTFGEVHGVRFPYVAGEMANGIATSRMVVAMAKASMLGFFGAAGLSPERVEKGIDEIEGGVAKGAAWGSNLIHSPNEPDLENAIADLYIRRGVSRVSASAYMRLTPAIVRYAAHGLHRAPDGRIGRRTHVFAKISRPEVAKRFLEPAPKEMLDALVSRGLLTAEEAQLAAHVPVAEDFTVEADSGGHTDNQPLGALFPTITSLRDRIVQERAYRRPIRIGAAGGLGTPTSIAAAFQMGAAYVMTGSINQACVESGLSQEGKKLLLQAGLADVVMAPAADMFELGVEVQVLSRGTMFAPRARKLYELYRAHPGLEAIPAEERARLEKEMLQCSVADAWASTRAYWQARDPREIEKAEKDPKHKMALVFRSYLGQSSRWAIAGDVPRRVDYQIWCGPAMGAFNDWAKGSFLEKLEERGVVQVALNLLEGAAVVTRAQQLRSYGVPVPAEAFDYRPRTLDAS
jgi:trans-AT polyketide synthase, acyltransferase and oxidoreductase domains